METLRLRFTGIRPLLMHNSQLADPSNPATRAIKELTGNKKKTDAIHEEIKRLEWLGSLYQNEAGRIVVTEDIVLGTGIRGAASMKKGPAMKAGVLGAEPYYLLDYDGPKDVLELYADGKHIDYRGVVVQRARTMRARPRFDRWSLDVVLHVDDETINPRDVLRAYEIAGRIHGIGDFRPRFGRFEVTQLDA